jgi:PAS domain S-box-containing protein
VQSEERYRRAAVAGRVGVWDWNLVTGEIYVDPVFNDILGYECEEIPNHMDDWRRLVHPDDRSLLRETAEAHIEGEALLFQLEHRMMHRDGSIRWILATGSVTRDSQGRAISMAGTSTDITERRLQEEALRQAKELNNRIVESSNDCIMILDIEGRLLHINQAGLRLLELEDDSLLKGVPIAQSFESPHRERAEQAVAAACEGRSDRFHGFSRTASGKGRWWDVAVSPIHGPDGKPAQLLAVSRDITERHREEQFRAAEHRMLEMIASGSALSAVLDSLVRLIEQYSHGTFCSVLLLNPDGATASHGAAPSLHPDYIDAVDGIRIGARSGSCGTAMFTRSTVIVTDTYEDPLWAPYRDLARKFGLRACWSTPIFSPERDVLGSFAMYAMEPRAPRDDELQLLESAAHYARVAIEHHRAQRALRLSEARNRAILRAIPDWMFLMSSDGTFLDYHASDTSVLYADPTEFIGKRIEDVLPQPLAGVLMGAFQRVVDTDESETVQYSLPGENGETFFEASIVRCDGDKVLSIVRDITDRKRAEVEAAEQRRELAHLGRVAVLGELTGALAHELSQPLAAMRTNAAAARLILDADPPMIDELREATEDIIKNNRRAGAVIDRLRSLLRKEDSDFHPVDLNDLVREVVDLAHSEILSRRVTVTTNLAPALPRLAGDRVQLQQVILNLVLNACDAMSDVPESQRELTLATELDGGFVQLIVSDCGTGIPSGELDNVFEPFVTFRKKGLGLGLAISRSIVTAHRGSIRAENKADGGAVFRCFFPCIDAAEGRRAV